MYFNDLNTNFIFLDISVDTFMKYVYTCIRKIRIQYGAKFIDFMHLILHDCFVEFVKIFVK